MKLAEALQERADLNRKISELRNRLGNAILVQEGEDPVEDPTDLISELDNSINRLEYLMAVINHTNDQTKAEGMTLTQIIAKKDAQNMFAIDNFKMSHEKVYDGVKGIEFISPAGTSTDKTNFSPDVTEIKVTLSDKLDEVKKEDITLRTTEGRKIDTEINYDSENGILSIFPKKSIITRYKTEREVLC